MTENYNKICEAAVTLTGACALVVRGGDGGRDSTGSDGVALLAIPRSPFLRVHHGLDENNRWCWLRRQRLQRQLQLLDIVTSWQDIVDAAVVAVADDDVAAVEIVVFYCFLADSVQLLDPLERFVAIYSLHS